MTKRVHPHPPVARRDAPELPHRIDPHKRFRARYPLRSGYLVCGRCGAIGFEKQWYIDPVEAEFLKSQVEAQMVLCPGCTRVEQETVEGEVVLQSSLLSTDRPALMSLIKHIEWQCWYADPSARIASIIERDGILELRTTTRSLATSIGEALHKTLKGDLEITPIAHHRFIRVRWSENSSHKAMKALVSTAGLKASTSLKGHKQEAEA